MSENEKFLVCVARIALFWTGNSECFLLILFHIKPLQIAPKMLENRMMMPAEYEHKKPIPTEPIINMGPLTEQNAIIVLALLEDNCLALHCSRISFVPMGYPDRQDNKKVKMPLLKEELKGFLFESWTISLLNTKKGNNKGKTLSAQTEIPFKKHFA